MTTSEEPDSAKYVTAYWLILATAGLALLLGVSFALVGWDSLGGGVLESLGGSEILSMLARLAWGASVFLALFVAFVQKRWGWLIAVLLVPGAGIVLALGGLSEVRRECRPAKGYYTTPEVRAQAEAEHDLGRRVS